MKTIILSVFLFSFSLANAQTPVVRLKTGTTPTNANCMSWGVVGSIFTAGDSGTPCGGTSITSGPFSSLPASCFHSATASDMYLPSDSYYTFICTATNTFSPFSDGKQMVLPTAASTWTLVSGTG